MVIKGVEHQDVSKKFSNLIQLNKRYTKIGNETLNFFKQRLQEKYDFLDKVKKKNNRLRYLKEVKKVKKHDKMRLRKIKKTEPFPLFSSKYFKNTKYIFKQVKPLTTETNLFNYNRILFVHNIYQKLNNKYYYYNNKLKKYAKKKKKKFKLKLHLWKTLSFINYFNSTKFFKNTSLDLDYQLKFVSFIHNNYYNKIKCKKKNFNTIFKNNNNIFLKSVYKVFSYNNFIKFYQAHFLDNFFYFNLNFKSNIINTYYNKIFYFNYDINYFIDFYNILKFKLLSNIAFKLNLKNYYNFLNLNRASYKKKKMSTVFNPYSIYNIIHKEKPNILNLKNKFNILVKKACYTTLKLMKAKKWTKRALTKINTKILKKLIANNARLNMYVNDKTKIKKKAYKVNYFLSSTFFKEVQKPIKIRKYNFYFLNFLKKFTILQQRIVKKYNHYDYRIFNKYNFLVNFFSYYFKQLFYCLKFIFNSNVNNLYLFILKLKFVLFYIYHKLFLRYIKPFKCVKKKKKLINSNKVYTFNILLYYRKMFKIWLNKKKQEWKVNRYKKIENDIDKFDKYRKPINLFIYNPLLNPRHNLWASRKKQKYKKIYSVIKYKINGYLRWFKWENKRKKYFKYRLMLIKKRQNKFKKKNKCLKPKMVAIKKLKKLIKKCTKIWKKKTKIKKQRLKKKLIKIKNKYLFKRNRIKGPVLSALKIFSKKRKKKLIKIKKKLILKKKLVSFKRRKSLFALYKKIKLQLYRLWIKKLKKFYMRKPVYKSNAQNQKYKKNYKYKTNIKLK